MPYSAREVKARRRIERILLVGHAKGGKTHAAVLTSPSPFVFNTDGKGALDGPVAHGADFVAEDITGYKSFQKAFSYLKANLKDFKTVIFDNVSSFSMMLEDEIRDSVKRDDPRIIYPELKRRMTRVVRDLISLPINVIIVGHVDTNENAAAGGFDHMLNMSGGAKLAIPILVQDWIWLEVTVDPNTNEVTREFLLAPQGTWKKAVRSIKDVARMEADFGKFFALASQGSEYVEGNAAEEVVETIAPDDENNADDTALSEDPALVLSPEEAEAVVENLPELIVPKDDEDEEQVKVQAAERAQAQTVSSPDAAWSPKTNGTTKATSKRAVQPARRA